MQNVSRGASFQSGDTNDRSNAGIKQPGDRKSLLSRGIG